jgi:hypothetical protein
MVFNRVTSNNSPANLEASKKREISIRRIPYPYRAMLAICSDLDETPDGEVYIEIMKFLNTAKSTAMGPGVGLEVGNTIYFDMPPNQFSYQNTDERGRDMIRTLIRSGHIDCLHSYGDLATTRPHAGRALEELSKYGCKLEVWIDHAVAPSNFGADIMKGLGDVPESEVYHADLTCDYGIKYVWRGRITSIVGQNVPRSLRGLYNSDHPLGSLKTIAKEFVKGILARGGNSKYAMHGPNEVLRRVELRDGHKVWEFIRSNPYWGGVENSATAGGLSDVLNKPMLDQLVNCQGICILYTHLGKIRNRNEPFSSSTQMSLELLAQYSREGKILVTTTRRLLNYCQALREVSFSRSTSGNGLMIDVISDNRKKGEYLTPANIEGLSFYVQDPAKTKVTVNGYEVDGIKCNNPDHTGQKSISFPWTPMQFPDL